MRYMIMHKTSAYWEGGAKPTPEVMQRVGGMIGELQQSGVLRDGEGLGPSSQGARVRLADGKIMVTPGPFGGVGALPARYAIYRAGSVDQAAEIAARFGGIFGDGVVDVRPVNEMWDLGFAQKPAGLTTRRYMAVVNAGAASEAGAPLNPEQRSALKAFADDLGRMDMFLGIGHFEPGAKGKRLQPAVPATSRATSVATPTVQAKFRVLDGPFTETKELIGGFVTVEAPSIEEAVRWAQRYIEAVDVEEVDVRGLESEP
ncbi:MAG: hypothetical protein JWO30_4533 [Fibrobacteres bacterium]|nr:hypothetical protein [Fibrobacterota bacterium]